MIFKMLPLVFTVDSLLYDGQEVSRKWTEILELLPRNCTGLTGSRLAFLADTSSTLQSMETILSSYVKGHCFNFLIINFKVYFGHKNQLPSSLCSLTASNGSTWYFTIYIPHRIFHYHWCNPLCQPSVGRLGAGLALHWRKHLPWATNCWRQPNCLLPALCCVKGQWQRLREKTGCVGWLQSVWMRGHPLQQQ